jgi:hypothetical protein
MTVALFSSQQKEVFMSIKPDKVIKYYRLDNTGFTAGTSWFEGCRYETFEQAKEMHSNRNWKDKSVKWRIVEVTIFRYFQDETQPFLETQKVTQERYLYVNQD